MTSSTDDLIWTDDRLKKITSEDGRKVDFVSELEPGDLKKLKDHHVMDVLTNHVNADLVTAITLSCSGITNDTLIQISNMMCPNLEALYVADCDMITDDGIVGIAEKCGQQLKELDYSGCKKCTDAALKSIVNNCNQLEVLYANDCGISTIPESIGYKLTKLKYLDLSDNNITKIPVSLILLKDALALKDKDDFDIDDNDPLQVPPSEVAYQGLAAIWRYFEEIRKKVPSSGIADQGLAAIERYFEKIRKKGSTISNTLKSRSR
jgi:Leucine-rich repeat (LRR) protein